LGLDLGSTKLLKNTIMWNLLGPKNFTGKYKPITISPQKGVFLKMYNKMESKPKRKLGHLNVVDLDNSENIDTLFKKLEDVKKSIKIEPI
jgi:5-(carboxyamino)imidazole ribonucleotide synthase